MLNRRKQQDFYGEQAGDERAALLGSGSIADNQLVVRNHDQIVPSTTVTTSRHVPPYSYNQLPNGPSSLEKTVPMKVQRRIRNKAQDQLATTNNLIRDCQSSNIIYTNRGQPIGSSSSVPKYQELYRDSYEFGVSFNSYSRAIDISSVSDSTSHKSQTATDFIYYTVQPGDTLHNLSVKYSCPVASIKRLNNLWSDQEFYGLTKLKLPAGKLRLIAGVVNEQHSDNPYDKIISASNATNYAESTLNALQTNQLLSTRISADPFHHSQIDSRTHSEQELNPGNLDVETLSSIRDSIFKDYDLNIERARTAARSYSDNASAIMKSLAESGNIVSDTDDKLNNDPSKIARREAETLLNDMSDYGISYSGLILFIFIVCLICPLAYVIYLEETHHDPKKSP